MGMFNTYSKQKNVNKNLAFVQYCTLQYLYGFGIPIFKIANANILIILGEDCENKSIIRCCTSPPPILLVGMGNVP